MLPITNTTFDLLILQFILHASSFSLLLLRIFAPICAGSKYNVLTVNILESAPSTWARGSPTRC